MDTGQLSFGYDLTISFVYTIMHSTELVEKLKNCINMSGPWIKTIFCYVVTFINSVKDFNINKEVLLFHLLLVFRIIFIELYRINPRLNPL